MAPMVPEKLNRSKSVYLICGLWIILSAAVFIHTCTEPIFEDFLLAFFFWFSLTVCILYTLQLLMILRYPVLSIGQGKICFFPMQQNPFKRVSLPLADIETITEARRKTGGFSKLIDLPTFLFTMQNGARHEYFPALKEGRALDAARSLIDRTATRRGIEQGRDDSLVLDDCRKQSADLMIYLFGVFVLILLLSAMNVYLG